MENLPKGFRYSKSLGQNFLVDTAVPRRIADAAGISGANVLEIGPGSGALTRELLPLAKKLLAIETDARLIAALQAEFGVDSRFSLIKTDALRANLNALCDEYFGIGEPVKICANLPYAITTPILTKLIEAKRFASITVMIQREVAARICALPDTPDYGAYSLFAQYHTAPERHFDVPPDAFYPVPKVTSTVITLTPLSVPDNPRLFGLIKSAFAQRRKTLANALLAGRQVPKDVTVNALEILGYNANTRGEVLSLADFIRLRELLSEGVDA
ncbi:MAG: 16S rRNA (adenine(1518)-N(6)/adenine(1519)-N(6))-dimethyltransferase RsmA [Oscillospiraceae bacterium]|jgi:16S rRNA (adenine1518-N6/adenine1519-N6)-dimethyltransferase|nr:16S rRNA (adenine(1518)-N(6)/adenine(1519)-N(6))-dimethyltransferase RsmA [Oscillospiraceae bacterium]